jgi:hypothetical protein
LNYEDIIKEYRKLVKEEIHNLYRSLIVIEGQKHTVNTTTHQIINSMRNCQPSEASSRSAAQEFPVLL